MKKYIPTANQLIALPCIRQQDGGIENFTFLHMAYKGMLEVHGNKDEALFQPFWEIDGKPAEKTELSWRRIHSWIPAFSTKTAGVGIEGIILTPVNERGFAIRLRGINEGNTRAELNLGLHGCWSGALHRVNESKAVKASLNCFNSLWSNGPVFEAMHAVPMFAFAPISEEGCENSFEINENGGVKYKLWKKALLMPGESFSFTVFWGLGFEEVAAATGAKEMMRQGWEAEFEKTCAWLNERQFTLPDPYLNELYNINLFFCFFFSTGITLDTEELVLVTSRSPRYYVSAAYWDRDSLLWSFPAILDSDPKLAKEMLLYVFGRQRRNIGVHSRFIDGTVLEPGFELDELMAPILALERYIDKTQDRSLLAAANVEEGLSLIMERLAERKHPKTALFSTFLQPTDDEIVYPYLTYNNVLVWRALNSLERLCPGRFTPPAAPEEIKSAINKHCIKNIGGKRAYAWSVDLEGNHDVYDEPPGSLQLLAWHGFCKTDDPVWLATVEHIRSPEYKYSFAGKEIAEIGCAHAPHPWVLSIANSLLCGHEKTAVQHLKKIKMDNLIACESVDEHTGECTTGEAFATCAGFLCHALRRAFEKEDTPWETISG